MTHDSVVKNEGRGDACSGVVYPQRLGRRAARATDRTGQPQPKHSTHGSGGAIRSRRCGPPMVCPGDGRPRAVPAGLQVRDAENAASWDPE